MGYRVEKGRKVRVVYAVGFQKMALTNTFKGNVNDRMDMLNG